MASGLQPFIFRGSQLSSLSTHSQTPHCNINKATMTLTQVAEIKPPNQLKPCPGKPNNIWVKQAKSVTTQNALHCKKYHQKFGCVRLTCADAQEHMTLTNETNDFTVPTQPTEPDYDAATSAVGVGNRVRAIGIAPALE